MKKYVIDPNLAKMAKENTVIVESILLSKENASINTGIVIAPNKVFTSLHCIKGKTVIIKDGKKYPIRAAGTFLSDADVAVLTVDNPVFHKPDLQIQTNVGQGEYLFWAAPFADLSETIFCGYVTALIKGDDDIVYYHVDGKMISGMSGAGVYNYEGALVGIIKGIRDYKGSNIGFVLPVAYFQSLIYSYRPDLI